MGREVKDIQVERSVSGFLVQVYLHRSYIEIGQTDFVIDSIKKTFKERHVSFVYEDICREKVGWRR